MSQDPDPVLISPETAARMCDTTRSTIYSWMRAGELPSVKIRGLRRIRVADLHRLAGGKAPEDAA